jgi:hypothetical protein
MMLHPEHYKVPHLHHGNVAGNSDAFARSGSSRTMMKKRRSVLGTIQGRVLLQRKT